MLLLTEDEMRARVRAKLESNDWWVVPWFGPNAAAFCVRVEETFFTGRHAAGCEVTHGPLPTAFFAKRRLPVGLLAREMIAFGSDLTERELVAMLADHDVLVLDGAAGPSPLVFAWRDWVEGDGAW